MKFFTDTEQKSIFAVYDGGTHGNFAQRQATAFANLERDRKKHAENGLNLVWTRIFLSDIANQQAQIAENTGNIAGECALSVVEQPPLDGSKIKIMACFLKNAEVRQIRSNAWGIEFEGRNHIYHTVRLGGANSHADGYTQTMEAFESHNALLASLGMDIPSHTLRTWLFCHDIDRTYQDIVKGRNEFFSQNGLTADTHFIASTGIGGDSEASESTVAIDFWSREGDNGDVEYLHAPDNLNPTSQYGVAFERGAVFSSGKRRVCLVSGTASIDNLGRCIHIDDVEAQTERMLDNIEALLADAGAGLKNTAMMIFYLRDAADAGSVARIAQRRLPEGIAAVYVQGRVCRPAWLVEAECVATV